MSLLGAAVAGALLAEKTCSRARAGTRCAGGLVWAVAADRVLGGGLEASGRGGRLERVAGAPFLGRRFGHSRSGGGRVTRRTVGGGLTGAGVAALSNRDNPGPPRGPGLAAVGGLIGLSATERYLDPAADAGQQ